MQKEIQTWLEDIKQSIEEIDSFLPETRHFFEFQKDLKTRKAVERNIEIIGEAVNRILQFDPEIQISHARKIVDTRNRIIHGYDSVSEDIIWAIVTRDLGQLQKEINSLLNY
ncbi:HepT-like ribonuclease domain-containing protein [Geofilum rubicundum]|uniref:Antitoxin n=1 Tax=Geofilum rubicundum JCM 15548 TaxID=1236989 RepID=A0A0E9M0J7_9BACT|nr:HepT-like ribonuclease domain-containing protein [Geofilum rubicundum]GAO31014.1 hypothetical protein JCM15548_13346 [Geofilum rubicundum JCM 15548]